MTDLVIEGMANSNDIAGVIEYLNEILAYGEEETFFSHEVFTLIREGVPSVKRMYEMVNFYGDDTCYKMDHREGCTCTQDAANTDPWQLKLLTAEYHNGPVPYQPCSKQGTHESLTECWMCWSDVYRGAVQLEDVLSLGLRNQGGLE